MKTGKKYIITAAILFGFVFNFLHSELSLFEHGGEETHGCYDFCLIVSAAKTNISSINASFEKAHKIIQAASVPDPSYTIITAVNTETEIVPCLKDGTAGAPLFVANRTLLI